MAKSFSQDKLLQDLEKLAQSIAIQEGFNLSDGRKQVEKSDISRIIAYGEFHRIHRIIADIRHGYLGT